MCVFGVILVRIFLHSDWIQTRITPNTNTFYAVLINYCYIEKSHFNVTNNWSTVKLLNSGHLRFLKNLAVIKRCLLLGDSFAKNCHIWDLLGLNILSAFQGVSAIWDVHYWKVWMYHLIFVCRKELQMDFYFCNILSSKYTHTPQTIADLSLLNIRKLKYWKEYRY